MQAEIQADAAPGNHIAAANGQRKIRRREVEIQASRQPDGVEIKSQRQNQVQSQRGEAGFASSRTMPRTPATAKGMRIAG